MQELGKNWRIFVYESKSDKTKQNEIFARSEGRSGRWPLLPKETDKLSVTLSRYITLHTYVQGNP